MPNEDIYLNAIKRMKLPLPLNTITFKNLQKDNRRKRLKLVKAPGVYIIKGERENSTEILYVGKTKAKTTHVGDRVYKQITQDDTFRKNLKNNGYTFCTDYQIYMSLKETQNPVYVSEVKIITFANTIKGFLARDLLEILLIAENDPYFNKEFAYLSKKDRFDQEFKHNYEKMTAAELSDEDLVGMQIYSNRD